MGNNNVTIGYLSDFSGLNNIIKNGINNVDAAIEPNIYHISITKLKLIAIIYEIIPVKIRAILLLFFFFLFIKSLLIVIEETKKKLSIVDITIDNRPI